MGGPVAVGWLAHTAVGGGLLLLVARGLMALTDAPARRQRLAELGALAALVLAVLSLGPKWISLPVPAFETAAPPAVAPDPAEADAAEPEDEGHEDLPAGALSAVPEGEAPAPPAPATPPPSAPPPWLSWERAARLVAWGYVGVAALLLGRWLLGHGVLWWWLRRTEPVPGRLAALFAEMAGGRRVRLRVSGRVRAPFSYGLLRPTVVLPAGLARGAPEGVLRWVLAHELTHLARRDAWTALLFAAAQGLYYYLPWFWSLRRQARLSQEYIADAAAAAAADAPEDYAQFLLSWTAAPALPAGAAGVFGSSSDLFWRINMLLREDARVEPRCPRRWTVTAGGGLLALAVLAAGLGLRAQAADGAKEEPKKAEPKKEAPKKAPKAIEMPALPDLDKLLEKLPPGLDPDAVKELRQRMEEMRRAMEGARRGLPGMPGGAWGGFGRRGESRLGAQVEGPSATLVDQLDLPKGRGLVLQEVKDGSAAAKAGLKKHDVLLELGGKPVPSEPAEFVKLLGGIKADAPVDAVVLRKGKKETVKGLKLPEAKDVRPARPVVPLPRPGFFPGGAGGGGVGGGVSMSMTRKGDQFTTTRTEGGETITVTGKLDKGKAEVSEVAVTEGGKTTKYPSVDKVPAKHQKKVEQLVEASEKGSGTIRSERP